MNYIQLNWPNPDYPTTGSVDPPFAAPFYAYINYRVGQSYEPSQISYRILDPTTTTSSSVQNIITGMLNYISQHVRQAVVGATYFSAQRGFVITYYNVTLYGNPCTTGQNLYDTCLVSDSMTCFVFRSDAFLLRDTRETWWNKLHPVTLVCNTVEQTCVPCSVPRGTRVTSAQLP
jgi:hypothetical protein